MRRFALKGFTLIEVLVVVAIIGIISGLSVFGIKDARANARDSVRKSNMEMVASALELYKLDCNKYPDVLPSPGQPLTGKNPSGRCKTSNVYIASMPADPQGPSRFYNYYSPPNNKSYEFCSSLEKSTGNTVTCGGSSVCGSQISQNINVPMIGQNTVLAAQPTPTPIPNYCPGAPDGRLTYACFPGYQNGPCSVTHCENQAAVFLSGRDYTLNLNPICPTGYYLNPNQNIVAYNTKELASANGTFNDPNSWINPWYMIGGGCQGGNCSWAFNLRYDFPSPGTHRIGISGNNDQYTRYFVGLASQNEGTTSNSQYSFNPISPFPNQAMSATNNVPITTDNYGGPVNDNHWFVKWNSWRVPSGTYDINFSVPSNFCLPGTPPPTITPTPTATPDWGTPTPQPAACNYKVTSP